MFFSVVSKLDIIIGVSRDRWRLIIDSKHPEIEGRENEVRHTLVDPDEIRTSKSDPKVFLYYKRYEKLWLAVVAKHLNGEGFIITVYFTDKIKEGTQTFRKKL